MPQSRCRLCKKRPIWRYRNNDLHACKRCYHRVWNDTRQCIRAYRAAIAALERGEIPALLSSYGGMPQEIAAELAHDLHMMSWSTGVKHEVRPLIARCQALANQVRGPSMSC
jgi:hypothetical protein